MTIYTITPEHGFLATLPEDVLSDNLAHDITRGLPSAIAKGAEATARFLHDVPPVDMTQPTPAEVEIKHMLYGYLACAWVHGTGDTTIPASIAQSLVWLGAKLERPPMLAYAGMVLCNWRQKDSGTDFSPENVELRLRFTELIDETWFFRVHIAIEAQAGAMLTALSDARFAVATDNRQQVLSCLREMQAGLVKITQTFHRMPDLCDPDIYYQQVRPFLMGFGEQVVFAGVEHNPTPLRGGSGAQSSVVPALLAGLGIQHQSTALTHNLNDMRRYMPREHRAYIQSMVGHPLRDYCADYAPLRDAYNRVLQHLITFRRAHLYYARTYIFEKSTNPIGTGGTEYMGFLSKLIDETANQRL
ncbi:MAG: hypothetical protein AAFQ52_08670 [Chloroflexota bacterium]